MLRLGSQGMGSHVEIEFAVNLQVEKDKPKEFALLPAVKPTIRAAYLIWRNPLMVAGRGTFIDAMLTKLGVVNVFGHLHRYPQIGPDVLAKSNADLLLLSSEPYPFNKTHIAAFRSVLPGAAISLVDARPFSWYGSRTIFTPAYFEKLRRMLKIS